MTPIDPRDEGPSGRDLAMRGCVGPGLFALCLLGFASAAIMLVFIVLLGGVNIGESMPMLLLVSASFLLGATILCGWITFGRRSRRELAHPERPSGREIALRFIVAPLMFLVGLGNVIGRLFTIDPEQTPEPRFKLALDTLWARLFDQPSTGILPFIAGLALMALAVWIAFGRSRKRGGGARAGAEQPAGAGQQAAQSLPAGQVQQAGHAQQAGQGRETDGVERGPRL